MSERFTPWFGAWPPTLRGEKVPVKQLKKRVHGVELKTLIHWKIVIPFFMFGVLLLLLSHIEERQTLKAALEHGGIALIVASILGGTIEGFLRKDLINDAFKSSIGYILPEELKEEMQWIYELSLLATYRHDIVIEKCVGSPGKVVLREEINRTFENIGNKDEEIKPTLGIQEWFHSEGYSEITSYDLTYGDEKYSYEEGGIKIGRGKKDKQSNYILAVEEKTLAKLKPKGKYTWVAHMTEIKHENDDSVSFFGAATVNPYITVKVPYGMDFDVTFANRNQGELQNLGSGHFRLNATLLPGQAIRIRWWNINDSEKWKQAIDQKYREAPQHK